MVFISANANKMNYPTDFRSYLLHKDFRLDENATCNTMPKWLVALMDKNMTYKKMSGRNKDVYILNNDAIAISNRSAFDDDLVRELKSIDNKYQKFLVYPTDTCILKGSFQDKPMTLYVSRLNNCPGGDLFDLLVDYDNYNRTNSDFIKLLLTLNELHKKNIYLCDIKPENIMLCNCNCLAFIDLDDAIMEKDLVDGTLKKEKNYVATFFFNPLIGKKIDKTTGMLRYADIFAWAMTFMEHLLLKRFRHIASKYNKRDPLYGAFYDSKESTLKNLKYNFDFLDVNMPDIDSMLSIIVGFIRNFESDLQINLMDPIWRANTDWKKESDNFVTQVLTLFYQVKSGLTIRKPQLKF